jgi:parvulin-like peptidyl-prolyl isomerase
LFGVDFASALGQMKPGLAWQGPVSSALGSHLIRLDATTPSRQPPFEEVRAAVEADWLESQRLESNTEAVAEIVARYKVEVEGVAE